MKYNIEEDIKKIKDAGVVFDYWIDIEDDVYHGLPGISASGIKYIDKECPMKFKYMKENQLYEESEALVLGRAIHKYVLENDLFEDDFVFSPVDKKTERKWKVFENEMKDSGKVILRARDKDMLSGMIKSLRLPKDQYGTNTYDGIIINKNTIREKALFTIDKERNIILKVKVDINLDGLMIDLKSTKNANPPQFMKDAANMGYGLQAAFYTYVASMAKKKSKLFGFIAIEKTPPFMHSVIVMEHNDILLEKSKMLRIVDEYAYCLNHGIWYGYNGIDRKTGNQPLFVTGKLPAWHRYVLEEANDFKGD